MRRIPALAIAALTALVLAVPASAAPNAALTSTADATTEPADQFDPTTVLVSVAREDRDAVHAAAGFEVVNRLRGIGVDVVRVPEGAVLDAVDVYRAMPEVRFAEPNWVVSLSATPNDYFVREQYALRRIKAFGGWSDYGHLWRRTGGSKLAIVDSGIDMLHREFAGRVSHCRRWLTGIGLGASGCQDSMFHGTHVAGIAAATTNNRRGGTLDGGGIAGIAFDSRIMALQAFNTSGKALIADIAAAIMYAARNGAHVANYSFSADRGSSTERQAIEYAARRGVVQVAAAGNTGRRGVGYPAAYRQVIAVSATNQSDRLAKFSTWGPQVDVAAPGADILSTIPGTLLYARLSGTSMAAPHVAGLAALLREQGFGPGRTRDRIQNRATDLGPNGNDPYYGHGRINMRASLD